MNDGSGHLVLVATHNTIVGEHAEAIAIDCWCDRWDERRCGRVDVTKPEGFGDGSLDQGMACSNKRTTLLTPAPGFNDVVIVEDMGGLICGVNPLQPARGTRDNLLGPRQEGDPVDGVMGIALVEVEHHTVGVHAPFSLPGSGHVGNDLNSCGGLDGQLEREQVLFQRVGLCVQQRIPYRTSPSLSATHRARIDGTIFSGLLEGIPLGAGDEGDELVGSFAIGQQRGELAEDWCDIVRGLSFDALFEEIGSEATRSSSCASAEAPNRRQDPFLGDGVCWDRWWENHGCLVGGWNWELAAHHPQRLVRSWREAFACKCCDRFTWHPQRRALLCGVRTSLGFSLG